MTLRWRTEQDALSGFHAAIPEDASVALCQIGNHRDALLGEEVDGTERMAEVRLQGYTSGRLCAHLVQEMLGLAPSAIGREKRAPIWPATSVGSITHSEQTAGAIASIQHQGVGIDIETLGRVDEAMYRVLFTEQEQQDLQTLNADADTILFSAKEAIYKATYPTGRKFIGFREVQLDVDESARTFRVSYLGDHEPNEVMNRGQGYWLSHAGQVLTLFFIPR